MGSQKGKVVGRGDSAVPAPLLKKVMFIIVVVYCYCVFKSLDLHLTLKVSQFDSLAPGKMFLPQTQFYAVHRHEFKQHILICFNKWLSIMKIILDF